MAPKGQPFVSLVDKHVNYFHGILTLFKYLFVALRHLHENSFSRWFVIFQFGHAQLISVAFGVLNYCGCCFYPISRYFLVNVFSLMLVENILQEKQKLSLFKLYYNHLQHSQYCLLKLHFLSVNSVLGNCTTIGLRGPEARLAGSLPSSSGLLVISSSSLLSVSSKRPNLDAQFDDDTGVRIVKYFVHHYYQNSKNKDLMSWPPPPCTGLLRLMFL